MRRMSPLLPLLALAMGTAAADGDLSMRFYQAYTRGDTAPQLDYPASTLPDPVKTRLAKFDVEWGELSGLLQRAVLWDTGYVFASPAKLVQIQTNCQRTMADLNMDKSQIKLILNGNVTSSAGGDETTNEANADCTILRCGMNNHFLVQECSTDRFVPEAQCTVLASDMEGVDRMTGVVWAEDGHNPGVADPVLRVHASTAVDGVEINAYAIHLTDVPFIDTNSCKTRGDFIIPCRDRTPRDVDICPVDPGATVDAWLALISQPKPGEFSATAIVIVVVLAAMVIVLVGLVWFMYKHRKHMLESGMSPAHHLMSMGHKSTTLNSMAPLGRSRTA